MIDQKLFRYKIRPFSVIYGGSDGANHRFFINRGDHNKFLYKYDIYGNYPTADTYGRFDYQIDYTGEIVLDWDVWSSRQNNTRLQEFVSPLSNSINLTQGVTNLYIKIPKMPAGIISEGNGGLYNFLKPSVVMSAYSAETYIAEVDTELASEIDDDDLLYIRSNDIYEDLSSYNIVLPTTLDKVVSKGYLYVKIATITIGSTVSIQYFWTSNILNLNRYSSLHLPLLRAIDVYAGVEIGSINDAKEYLTFQYSRADWMIKTIDEIKSEAKDSCEDIESAIEQWGNYDEQVDTTSFKVKEVWITYVDKIRGKPKVERLYFDGTEEYESFFDALYGDSNTFNPNYFELVQA